MYLNEQEIPHLSRWQGCEDGLLPDWGISTEALGAFGFQASAFAQAHARLRR